MAIRLLLRAFADASFLSSPCPCSALLGSSFAHFKSDTLFLNGDIPWRLGRDSRSSSSLRPCASSPSSRKQQGTEASLRNYGVRGLEPDIQSRAAHHRVRARRSDDARGHPPPRSSSTVRALVHRGLITEPVRPQSREFMIINSGKKVFQRYLHISVWRNRAQE
jgi:hypothetical protein